MGVPISNVTRRVVYAASGTGPYAFTFEILANTDIAVYRDDTLLTLTTDYSVTIASNGTGSITLVASPTGATQIAIVGNRTIQRTTDFVTGGDFFANTVNDEMDQQTIFAQQNAEGLLRALSAPQTDPTTINMVLPRASLRANKALGFDADGNPAIADTLGTNRGNWAASTLYYVRDIVKDTTNNNIWQCITQHTSTGSQPINTNTDSAKWTLLVDAASASTSATNAASSASAASSSASAASTSATNAASSASAASTSASNASTSATSAASSASAASSSASTASTAATNAGNSATAAATSATNASNSASAASTSASNASSSASAASTSASNAATSATNASNSATAASGSASTAATQATNAANSATAAAGSATSAASAQTAAESARDATLAAYDSFDDRYLGTKTSDPTVDNDGNALVAGALYFNSTSGAMKLYTGSAWVAAYVSGTDFVAKSGDTMTGALTVLGALNVAGTSTAGSNIKLYEDTDNGTNYVAFKAPDTIASNVTWTLPSADGSSNQVLTTNGTGTLSWSTASGSSQWTTSGSNIYYNTGSVGVGTTSVVSSTGKAYQLGSNVLLQNVVNSQLMLSQNAVYDSTWKYITAGRAAAIRIGSQNDGEVTFHYSNAVGTAGGALSNWDSNKSMVITQTGQVLVGPTSAQSGGCNFQVSQGITFPATQSASSDANTLDDYEEGTFTPTISASSVTYGNRYARYIKIGALCYINCYIEISAITSPTGGAGANIINGLPFTCAATGDGGFYPGLTTKWKGGDWGGTIGIAQVVPSTTGIAGMACTNNANFVDSTPSSVWDAGGNFVHVTGCYIVA